jgi:hypothetical protein
MRHTFGHQLLTATLAIGVHAIVANAQAAQGPPPTPAQCATGVAALAANAKEAIQETVVYACGATGGAAISALLGRSHHESNTTFLTQLVTVSSFIQDGDVYVAARELARDRAATAPARAAGLLILLGQYTLNVGLAQSTTVLLSGETPVSCRIRAGESVSHFSSPVSVPLNFATRAQTIASAISADSTAPDLVHGIAMCVAAMLPAPPVDVSAVRMTYLCGSRFMVHNPTTSALELSYDVANGKKTGGITVQASADAVLFTNTVGTVRLSYQGRIIQTRRNKGTVCGD